MLPTYVRYDARELNLASWRGLLSHARTLLAANGISQDKLVGIQIVWPEGINGYEAIIPGCVELARKGLMAQGLELPEANIVSTLTLHHDLPVVRLYPVHNMTPITPLPLRVSDSSLNSVSTQDGRKPLIPELGITVPNVHVQESFLVHVSTQTPREASSVPEKFSWE